jgi:hypothetical protein
VNWAVSELVPLFPSMLQSEILRLNPFLSSGMACNNLLLVVETARGEIGDGEIALIHRLRPYPLSNKRRATGA